MAGQPFVVNVAALRKRSGSRRPVELEGVLPGLTVTGSAVPDEAVVSADLMLEGLAGEAILATGTVTTSWEGACRRCLGTAAGTLTVSVRELFEAAGDSEETYPLQGDRVDLEPLVRDAVLLELPQAPLCTEECRGLCPICGIDRNDGTCTCTREPDPRWAALDQLKEP
ncbi:MAG: hypothetical protein QOJ09_2361 [Actinomycetota bacterium]|jgi:uncharacterized protein|nr:hypothetical protein [Actinomycetota bacterium]